MNKLIVLVAALSITSCTPVSNAASIQIFGACMPNAPSADTGCTGPDTCTLLISSGFADLAATGGGFIIPMQFDNFLGNNSDPSSDRVDTNDFDLEQLELSYSGDGAFSAPDTVVNLSVAVRSGGHQVVFAELIPPKVGQFILPNLDANPKQLIVSIRGVGKTHDQSTLKTDIHSFPIDVCNGCAGAPPACPTAGQVLLSCPAFGQTGTAKCF